MPDQQQMPQSERAPWISKPTPLDGGPQIPKLEKPDTNKLLKRMRSVDSNQSKKYRQRTGQ